MSICCKTIFSLLHCAPFYIINREVHLGGRQRVPQGRKQPEELQGQGVCLVRGSEDSHRQVRAQAQREGHIAAGLLSPDHSELCFFLISHFQEIRKLQ